MMIVDITAAMTSVPALPPAFADWVSGPARARFATAVLGARAPEGDIAAVREFYDRFNGERLAVARRAHDVVVEEGEMGGIPVFRVMPAGRAANARTLMCLHGGAFMWGRGDGALVEAVPIAAVTGSTVVAPSYRLAPEHVFPAAVDDALACYQALAAAQSPSSIGVFGCSAGGILTAQMTARLVSEGSETPGAIAMLHGTGLEIGGDAAALAGALCGTGDVDILRGLVSLPYFHGADPDDALVFPGDHPDILADFPPALLVSGTRDFTAGSIATMHRRLRAAGSDADLVLFDGMWHAHHIDTDLPEARETFDLVARFFARHLS